MSGRFATAKPHRIKASHRRRWKRTAAHREYQHTDALGSPVATTNSAKTVLQRSEYEPYGYLLNRTMQDGPGYTGHVTDAATGLVYMQQRYYDPLCGCFLSTDPVTALGGPFNRYWYANDNPFRYIDPDGRYTCSDKESCAAAKAGLSSIKAALGNSSNSTRVHNALVAAKKFYGQEGHSNGVHIEAKGLDPGTTAQALTTKDESEPGGLKTVVQVDVDQLSGIAKAASLSVGTLLGEKFAHEGVHGATQRAIGHMLTERSKLRADEVSAYTTSALYDQGAGINPWGFLTPQGGISTETVNAAADRSTDTACASGYCK